MFSLRNLANRVAFAMRSRLRWSRSGYAPANEDKSAWLAAHPRLHSRAGQLARAYDLSILQRQSTMIEYCESMYVLDLLDRLFPRERLETAARPSSEADADTPGRRRAVRVLDVGAKNFAYAQGLAAFFRKIGGGNVLLTGIEVDGYPIYRDLHSRFDYAQWHLRGLSQARYLVGDVCSHAEQYNVITWFLPFVLPATQQSWGLPAPLFRPEPMLTHVAGLLSPGGTLLITNRETEERDAQLALLDAVGLAHGPACRYGEDWLAVAPRYVVAVQGEREIEKVSRSPIPDS